MQPEHAFFTSGDLADYQPAPPPPSDAHLANPDIPPRAASTGIDVLVVGGCTSGLTAAIECWRKGHTVTRILERSTAPTFTGDAFAVQPSALRIFRHWPAMHRDIDRDAIDAMVDYRRHTGEHIFGPSELPHNTPEHRQKREGEPKSGMMQNRVKFYRSLLRQALALGMQIEWGVRAVDYFEDEAQGKAGVRCDSGETYTADVVIAADGMKTVSHGLVNGVKDKPVPSGQSIYRTSYPLKYAMQDPLFRHELALKPGDRPLMTFWQGQRMYAGTMISQDSIIWAVTHHDSRSGSESSANESWKPDIKPEEVLSCIEAHSPDWSPALKALIRTAPSGSIVHWRLNWRDLQQTWTSASGRVVQIGDAAHAFLPTSGNGATQGMEDATALAACLQLCGGPASVGTATRIFNRLRYARIASIQKTMFVNAQIKAGMNVEAVKKDPRSVHRGYQSWMAEHDAERYVYEKYGEAYDELVNGGPPLRNTNYPKGHTVCAWSIDEVNREIAEGKQVSDLLDGDWS